MNKIEIIDHIAKSADISKAAAGRSLDAAVSAIKTAIAAGSISSRIVSDASRMYAAPTGFPTRLLVRATSTRPAYNGNWMEILRRARRAAGDRSAATAAARTSSA